MSEWGRALRTHWEERQEEVITEGHRGSPSYSVLELPVVG